MASRYLAPSAHDRQGWPRNLPQGRPASETSRNAAGAPDVSSSSMKRTDRTAGIPRKLGWWDQSFFIRMVVSFFVLTLVVAVLELGLRLAFALYEFHRARDDAQVAAERLANDIRSIMLNRGGPVASRTVYPILQRNFERAGLHIAIEPSEATETSIQRLFEFRPEGVRPLWPKGSHNEGRVEVRADEFCLQCHVDAALGDVLGTVVVRDYLSTRLREWWREVRLTGTLNLAKVGLHTIILFFLLRALLEPLLSLRSAVSRLAKGQAGLTTRAEVRSSDEFGDLANDLNAFLDRVDHVLADLHKTIARIVAVSTRLAQVTGRTGEQLREVERALYAALAGSPAAEGGAGVSVAENLADLERILDAVEARLGTEPKGSPVQVAEFRRRLHAVRADWNRCAQLAANLPGFVHQLHEFRHMLQEMRFLEEHLNGVAEAGQALLDRLTGRSEGSPPSGAPRGSGAAS